MQKQNISTTKHIKYKPLKTQSLAELYDYKKRPTTSHDIKATLTSWLNTTSLSSNSIVDTKISEDKLIPILDCRKEHEFTTAHIKHSTNIPFHLYSDLAHILPPRGCKIALVCGCKEEAEWLCTRLHARGDDVRFLLLIDSNNDIVINTAKELDLLQQGSHSRILWTPNPLIERFIPILQKYNTKATNKIATSLAMDVACGGGRDMIYLAMHGYTTVIGIDYQQQQLDRCMQMAQMHNVKGQVEVLQVDFEEEEKLKEKAKHAEQLRLKKMKRQLQRERQIQKEKEQASAANKRTKLESSSTDSISSVDNACTVESKKQKVIHSPVVASVSSNSQLSPPKSTCNMQLEKYINKADLVTVSRYLHRASLPLIKQLVAPGGLIAYHTFVDGCQLIGRPKKEKFLLKKGELKEFFGGWEILLDEVNPISDGRPLSFFIARKPPILSFDCNKP